MNKAIFFLLLIYNLSVQAQMQKATLFFKDGTELYGLARITSSGKKIKFKKNNEAKSVTYSSKEIESIALLVKKNGNSTNKANLQNAHYFYKNIEGKRTELLLELIVKGKVNLFRDLKIVGGGINTMGPQGPMMMRSYTISSYYASREDSRTVIHLGDKGDLFGKNFKKAASEYFKDCPELVKKIQNNVFKKNDIVDVVKFYNKKCSK